MVKAMVKYCFVVLFFSSSFCFAENFQIKENTIVKLSGQFVMAKGEDNFERPVFYKALKLDTPIDIHYEDGIHKEVRYLMLWLPPNAPKAFASNHNRKVVVTGKVHVYWHGPSTFPNPNKLEVAQIEPAK